MWFIAIREFKCLTCLHIKNLSQTCSDRMRNEIFYRKWVSLLASSAISRRHEKESFVSDNQFTEKILRTQRRVSLSNLKEMFANSCACLGSCGIQMTKALFLLFAKHRLNGNEKRCRLIELNELFTRLRGIPRRRMGRTVEDEELMVLKLLETKSCYLPSYLLKIKRSTTRSLTSAINFKGWKSNCCKVRSVSLTRSTSQVTAFKEFPTLRKVRRTKSVLITTIFASCSSSSEAKDLFDIFGSLFAVPRRW